VSELRINRTLRKNLQRERYEVRVDSDFETVIQACAAVERPDQLGTWITSEMIEAYCQLHALGFAHSVEAWQEGELMGGIYGLSLGAAFFGESMFARRSDASKVALAHLVSQLERWGFHFLDCQVYNDHTGSLGAREWPRAEFIEALSRALRVPTRLGPWRLELPPAALRA
jgi:leucyl/phenylalanyl-tRNA--protein transferase